MSFRDLVDRRSIPPGQRVVLRWTAWALLAGCTLGTMPVVLNGCRRSETTDFSAAPIPAQYDPAAFNADAAYRHLVELTEMGLRDSGTAGAEKAAIYLRNQLLDLGLDVAVDVFTNMTPRGPVIFRNVIGRVSSGTAPHIVIVGSHYDTKSGMPDGFQGANDSGSSTAVLLEIARVLASQPPPPHMQIWLAFFDGEECMVRYGPNDGLHGSRRLAELLTESGEAAAVHAVIVLDMIGDCDLTVTIPRNGTPELIQLAFQAAKEEGVRHRFSLFRHAIGDDHEPFFLRGMPAVNLIDFLYGSQPGQNDYWHTEQDRIEHVCPESLGIMGRVTLRMLNHLARNLLPRS